MSVNHFEKGAALMPVGILSIKVNYCLVTANVRNQLALSFYTFLRGTKGICFSRNLGSSLVISRVSSSINGMADRITRKQNKEII